MFSFKVLTFWISLSLYFAFLYLLWCLYSYISRVLTVAFFFELSNFLEWRMLWVLYHSWPMTSISSGRCDVVQHCPVSPKQTNWTGELMNCLTLTEPSPQRQPYTCWHYRQTTEWLLFSALSSLFYPLYLDISNYFQASFAIYSCCCCCLVLNPN